MRGDAVRLRELISRVRVITPNLPEAAALLDVPKRATKTKCERRRSRSLKLGAGAVLIKGGHQHKLAAARKASIFWSRPAPACV